MITTMSPDTSSPWRNLNNSPLTARIRDELLRTLEQNGMAAGSRLPSERELAASLGVSRPSVREAIKSLESEGRLVVRHGVGVFVAEKPTTARLRASVAAYEHNLDELYAMREVLEVPAARWAARNASRQELRNVSSALAQLNKAAARKEPDYEELQSLDMQFHLSIMRASGNRFLEQTLDVLNSILAEGMETTLVAEGRLEQSEAEHRRILDALQAGDSEGAARAARSHVRAARRVALARGRAQLDDLE